jgi:DNA-binding transcriptional MerR regulator
MAGTAEIVRAFSGDHVVRLTGLTTTQLRYWDKTGFFRPEYSEGARAPYGRVYSFQNVLGLRTLGILRKTYEIPLQQLRKVAQELSKHRNAPWSELALYVFERNVYFKEPTSGQVRSALSGQYALIELRTIAHDLANEAAKLKERSSDQIGRIERHRFIVHNAWAVAGTRIPTKTIKRFHDAGYSTEKIIREYPSLTEADIKAAVNHEVRQAKRA